ncbi:MAG TPA: malate dehydrogenase [Acidimicrobiales bacterium]|jgi:malate dehydrogenase|nr:malate dehydrogenase [Acidimicrobiales bacterium]
MKVSVAGAGFYGSTLAQRIAEAGYVDEVVLTDIVEGRPQGLALDLMQSRPVARFETRVTGTNGYAETAGSDICVITAGLPRKPGMSRMDLLETNARIVADVTAKLVAESPDAVLIVVSNPLDEMTALAAAVSGLPRNRVMGQAGMLDSARFRHFVAERLGVPTHEVTAITLGSHGDTMVPVPSQALVGDRPLTEVLDAAAIEEIVQRTRDGGAEVVALLKTGSAYFAPAAAAENMVRAVADNTHELQPVSAWVDGPYGIRGVYLGVPAALGRNGVEAVVELPLADEELAALRAAADAVRAKQAEVIALLP